MQEYWIMASPPAAAPHEGPAEEPAERTAEEATALFEAVERKFPAGTLGEERWYLLAVFRPFSPSLFPSKRLYKVMFRVLSGICPFR